MKSSSKNTTLWVWLLLISLSLLTLSACTSSKPSKRDLQLQHYADSLTASRASKISDRQAAIAAIDMLNACEKNLADSTVALQQTRKSIPKKVRRAKAYGAVLGGVSGIIVAVIYSIVK